MNINSWIRLGLAFLWILLITTCATGEYSQDPKIEPDDPFKEGSVPVKVPITRAVNDNDPENRVKSVRLILIKQNVVTNNKVIDNILDSETNVQLTDIAPVGYADLFVIVNELPGWNLGDIQVNDILSSDVVKKKILTFSAYPIVDGNHQIPMFRMYENLRITMDGETLLNGVLVSLSSVERLYAKVTLELNCVFEDLLNGGDPIEIKQVSLKSMPKESYLAPAQYTKSSASDFFDGSTLTLKVDSNYTWDDDHFESDFVCYIPEYLVSDISRYTYVSAVVNLTADEDAEREYKIVIGDGISQGNTYMLGNTKLYSDVRVSRNKHYHFTANIKSFDLTAEQDIEIRPVIVNWGEVILPSEIRDYLLQVSMDRFTFLSSLATAEGIIQVKTDYPGGWSATLVKSVTGHATALIGGPYSGESSGNLRFSTGGAIPYNAPDTIKVTAGKVTKHILISN